MLPNVHDNVCQRVMIQTATYTTSIRLPKLNSDDAVIMCLTFGLYTGSLHKP